MKEKPYKEWERKRPLFFNEKEGVKMTTIYIRDKQFKQKDSNTIVRIKDVKEAIEALLDNDVKNEFDMELCLSDQINSLLYRNFTGFTDQDRQLMDVEEYNDLIKDTIKNIVDQITTALLSTDKKFYNIKVYDDNLNISTTYEEARVRMTQGAVEELTKIFRDFSTLNMSDAFDNLFNNLASLLDKLEDAILYSIVGMTYNDLLNADAFDIIQIVVGASSFMQKMINEIFTENVKKKN